MTLRGPDTEEIDILLLVSWVECPCVVDSLIYRTIRDGPYTLSE